MKKQAQRKEAPKVELDGTVAFQVRMDADLHARLKREADQAGISMNQLIQGTLRGALERLVQGEADVSRSGFVQVRPQKGCLFFGSPGVSVPEPHERIHYQEAGITPPEKEDKGYVWFGLDFTNRGVVRYQQKE